jgi:hypothetical protein
MRQLKEIIFYLFVFVSIALVRYILNRKVVIKDEKLTNETLAVNEKKIRIFCMILTHNSNLRNNQVNLF